MGKAKYMSQRTDSAMSVVVYMERLQTHLFRITTNEKQFPKSYRYTLSAKIRDTCLEAYMDIYMASYIKPKDEEDFDRIRKYQNDAFDKLVALKALITASTSLANLTNVSYLAELYDDTTEAFNHWTKNLNRNYRKFKKHQAMTAEELEEERLKKRELYLSWQAKKLDRDSDGFVILKRRAPQKSKEERRNAT